MLTNRKKELRDMFEKYSHAIYRVCLKYTYSKADAEDLMMDVFVKMSKCEKVFEKESEVFSWLYRIAVNHSIDFVRAQKLHWNLKDLHLPRIDKGEINMEEWVLERMELRDAVSKLDKEDQALIFMHFESGMTQEEIAEVLNLSRPAVSRRLTHLKTKLRSLMGIHVTQAA